MELEYTRAESFEVKGIRFTCVSKWNGMEEWKDDQGRKMIVARRSEGGPFAEAFAHMFGESTANNLPGKLIVISAAPDLVALLKA
ncbi:hypothetical protein [Acidovorax sp. FJL06]|uniref:hypothetical protein n=1 Tax=Acidovorax sp. FJL06 TaxID=2153365 RepID=UPI000F5642AA|nr:hypothetical protein [Acidovorax sp. FJL06]RQO83501.1 hypothetical protein DBV10_04035 [Acidovorax sp. FJL06]